MPKTHQPADEGEVDFHDLWVVLRGVKTKTALFTMRLSYSGRAAHRASLSQGQDAFPEGHVFGNLTASVGEDWAVERELLRSLPAEPFDTTLTLMSLASVKGPPSCHDLGTTSAS